MHAKLAPPLLALALVGCYSSAPGVVRTSSGNPLVAVGAGEIEVAGATLDSERPAHALYIVDRRAEVCWFLVEESVAPMNCCALLKVVEAREYLGWVDERRCNPPSP